MAGGETNLGRKGSKMEGDLLVWAVAKAREICLGKISGLKRRRGGRGAFPFT